MTTCWSRRCNAALCVLMWCAWTLLPAPINAFSPTPLLTVLSTSTSTSSLFAGVATPTREETDRSTRRKDDLDRKANDDDDNEDMPLEERIRRNGPLEYLEDDMMMERNMEDPFHILLLQSTFDKPKITIPYVSSSLTYVLDMPMDEATELTQFCHDNGMSCLGTWTREECLTLGRQLQVRDIVCRVVPYCEGGQRGWQAKDASSSSSSTSSGQFLN